MVVPIPLGALVVDQMRNHWRVLNICEELLYNIIINKFILVFIYI